MMFIKTNVKSKGMKIKLLPLIYYCVHVHKEMIEDQK